MHPVGDQLDGHPRILQQRDDRAGFAVMDRAHRVEQVRAHGRARLDRRPGLFVGGLGVARPRRPRPRRRSARIAASAPSRSGARVTIRIAPPPAARTRSSSAGSGSRISGRLMGATAFGGDPRTFQMDARDHAGLHVLGQRRDLPQQLGGAGGDQRGDQRGGAVPAVQAPPRWPSRPASAVGEVRAAAAVHVHVDEPGHHRDRAEVAVGRPRRGAPADPTGLDDVDPAGTLNPRPAATVLGRCSRVSAAISEATQMPCQAGLAR